MLGVAEVEPLPKRPLLLNKDLFDAEDSDSDMDHDGPNSPTPPPDVNATPISGDRTPPPEEDNHLNIEEDGENSGHFDDTVDEDVTADTQKQKSSGKKNRKDKVEPLPERPLLLNKDIFDAEDSDSDMDHDGPNSPTPPPDVNATPISGDRTPPPEEDNHLNIEEDGENSGNIDDTVDEELTADAQKQKSSGKKNKKDKSSIAQSRIRRVKKVDAKKIHSESQRIIRESDVSLPYHKPKPLSLNDFFSKKPSNKGGLSVKSLKGLSKRQQIAHLIQEPNNHDSNSTKRKENASHISSSAKSPDQSSTNLDITVPEVKQLFTNEKSADSPPNKTGQKHEASVSDSQADNSMHLELDDSSNDSGIEDKTAPLVANSTSEIEMDLGLGKDSGGSSSKEGASESQESALFSEKDDSPSSNRATISEMNKSTSMEISNEEIGTTNETSGSHQETNSQESSELDKSGNENSKEFSGKNGNEDSGNREDLSATLETPSVQKDDNTTITLSSSTQKVKLSPKANLSQTPMQGQHSHNRLSLLNESLSKVKTLTPRLSGAADAIIDLDDDSDDVQFATPSNPGLHRLIERFAKHTARSAPRPTQEVKLSVVSKQSGGDGKEDLRLDTVAVTIEGEDVVDLALKVPGAKLLKLKEALQIKMRARREVERQRRKEAYRLDNEDYIENEDEITDNSETDDDDDDGRKDESKIKKKKPPKCHFLNREADVDDEDDDDYDPEDESGDSDSNSDQDDARSNNESAATKAEIYSAETDESDQDIENGDQDDNESGDEVVVVRTKSDKRKKKKHVLDDGDEDEDTGSKDVSMHEESTLELHLDADDEEEEHENKMNQDDSSMGFPTKTRTPLRLYHSTINTKHSENQSSRPNRPIESLSSIDGTTDSSDVDRLAESILHRGRSSKRSVINEEKTRDLFESTSNTDGGTTGSSEVGFGTENHVGQSSFSWSAIRKTRGISPRDVHVGQTNRELTKPLDSSSNSLDTSLELVGSLITAHQPGGGVRKNGCKESPDVNATRAFVPFAKHQSLLHNAPKSKLSEFTLPVEDSQDLYRADTPSLTVAMETQLGDDTQGFRFSYEDEETQTQFLDENGFLKLRSVSKPRPTTKKLFGDDNSTQDQMDELLGLCSGKFSNGASENVSKIRKGLFSQLGSTRCMDSTQGNMDEVLGLCSGTFATQNATSQGKTPSPNDIEDCSESSFRIISDDEGNENDDKKDVILSGDECSKPKTRKRIRVMDDDSDDDSDDQERAESEEEEAAGFFDSEDEMMVMLKEEQRNGKKEIPKKSVKDKIRKKISKDFFENEAELSGSEFDSDEDYDADDLPDELEQNEADKENVGTDEQLRQQVNKVYMKTMDDEDARQLRLYKEIYLPDGDLHTDGKGRTRQFRWRHLDDSQMNLFPNNSDNDDNEDENDEDTQWRMERFKREQWLNEHKEKQTVKESVDEDENIEEEGSQFDILMKTAVNKKKKVLPSVDTKGDESVPQKKDGEKRIASPKQTKFRHGSFLKRSKGDLAKIASMMKPLSNNPGTSRSSRNVLYQSISPQGEEDEDKSKPQLRRSTSDRPNTKAPKAKRPRLDRSQSLANPSSIFSLM